MKVLVLVLYFFLVPAIGFAATALDFETVLDAALRHSYDLRSSVLDIGISRALLKEARSAYYPTLSTRFNTQCTKDLTGSDIPQVTTVGETVISQNTGYQDSVSISASLNLYDFGIREHRVLMAKKDIPLKQAVSVQTTRDTKIKVLELYRDIQVSLSELTSRKQLLQLYKDLVRTEKRLFTAGLLSKIELSKEAVRLVKTIDEIDNLNLKIASALQELSFLTGENYDQEGLTLSPIEPKGEGKLFNLTNSPEYRIYELALEKKQAEITALHRETWFPQIGLYTSYIIYGQDSSSYRESYRDMSDRSYYVGLVANIPIFDGFKNRAQVEKARLELQQLQVEKEKKLSELSSRYEKLREQSRILGKSFDNQQEALTLAETAAMMKDRLAEKKIVEEVQRLRKQIELVTQRCELARAGILKAAAARELQIMAEGE
ncbi:MAG: outer membrane channel protein [Syntrophus sp. PtaB.Bin001]|nr:MAG: outer membrane channel protein [Syntrophus sp. PtaB.Bin001]